MGGESYFLYKRSLLINNKFVFCFFVLFTIVIYKRKIITKNGFKITIVDKIFIDWLINKTLDKLKICNLKVRHLIIIKGGNKNGLESP